MKDHHRQIRTLADVRQAIKNTDHPKARRDRWTTALNSLEHHSGVPLHNIPLDREVIRSVFATVNPRSRGIGVRTWTNVRSRCNTVIKVVLNGSSVALTERLPLSASWQKVRGHLRGKGEQHPLSSLMTWASREGIEPQDVDEDVIKRFNDARDDSLRPNSSRYQRSRLRIWNIVRERSPELGLACLAVPLIQLRRKRVPPSAFRDEFWQDTAAYLRWAGGADPFDSNARKRALSEQTLRAQWAHLHAAADALVKSGVDISSIRSISDLLTPERVRTICRIRFEGSGYKHTALNFEMGRTLVQVGNWIGLAAPQLSEIRSITRRQKRPEPKMTEKNKKIVGRFEDDELRQRLVHLPELLLEEARHQTGCKRSRLAKIHAALAIGCLTLFPVRLMNLASLRFGEHIDLTCGFGTIRFPREQVKNEQPLEFDIPPHYAALLKEYHDELGPLLTGKIRERVFVNTDGTPKRSGPLSTLIKSYAVRYLGVSINPHAFRHLAAKFILDDNPGAHVVVQHLLGHKNLETTATFYAGTDTKRAARHHHMLLMRQMEAPASSSVKGAA
ncbi:site-specific integrase [Mesorhizobium sp. YIM 152430]|uniref:site-specific integrase n=1 Tax=Mesorhizobium sp. YIM 152430 TaxID=3031761 RepID=UPI0023DBC42C|nr:site-specific integrase [Mesorhizobium sp. YIM 152430]MDF1600215.1 site-specific integrase [Mesorhizobium sp. YIM 152430]